MELEKLIEDQIEWSLKTFGPGTNHMVIIDHIKKELIEIEEDPTDISEWPDVVILALDGAHRAGYSPEDIALAIEHKRSINRDRQWPDWRTAEPGKAIEHVRGGRCPHCHGCTEYGHFTDFEYCPRCETAIERIK